ncbi:MAG: dTDP-glucose 4,6-dehydratase, partial [Armatimonadetes bacterium]|nr:dTDP-glucose 4,6-dehydratase [Armatimonadota bacterium]
EDVDAIINFAAETHVDRSILGADDFITTNVYGTFSLLEAARFAKIKRFLHISTDEVYGSIKEGSFNEDSLLNPSSPYSASKAGADLLAYSYFTTYKLPLVITRSSNNYGPYQYPEKLIPLFITNALENKPLPLYGDGLNVRDWLYVLDNCKGIDLIFHKGKEGEIYNLGAGEEKTNLEITHLILEIMEKPLSLIKKVTDRLGHDYRYSINSSKANFLGWKPEYPFIKGIKDTVRWYLENRIWWQKIKGKQEAYQSFYKKYYQESRLNS